MLLSNKASVMTPISEYEPRPKREISLTAIASNFPEAKSFKNFLKYRSCRNFVT